MSYLVNLDKFYGPLDLLLYLLERDQIDIYDIPIARITDQYIAYINDTGDSALDNIGDFLSMATYLLNLKSKMLLPVMTDADNMDEAEDPSRELADRILAYKHYKLLGECLGERYEDDSRRLFFRCRRIEIAGNEICTSVRALLNAWQSLQNRTFGKAELDHLPPSVAIAEKMEEIMARLAAQTSPILFSDMLALDGRRREMLVLFLALLELIRLRRVEAFQPDQFGDIRLTAGMAGERC